MTYNKYTDLEVAYSYDFSVQGGAIGSIELLPVTNALKAGMVIEDIQVYVESALVNAGNGATAILGPKGGDDDGYFVDFMALAEVAGSTLRAGQVAGALVWDNTNDNNLSYKIPSAT